MVIGKTCCFLVVVAVCHGEKWRFPEEETAASVRIDTKVKFVDDQSGQRKIQTTESSIQLDEVPFREPSETEGFYNRPPGDGRYPVRVESYRVPYRTEQGVYPVQNRPSDYDTEGTLDAIQYCKCVSSPECKPRPNSQDACGADQYLCCYKKPNRQQQHNSEFFNEIDDERPLLYPGQQNLARPFPPPPGTGLNGLFGPGHSHESGILGALDRPQNPSNQGVLSGPDGPTGVIGPGQRKPNVLVGPGGPTGIVGPPQNQASLTDLKGQKPAVLVGPGGPTGHIGPNKNQKFFGPSSEELTHSETAQRGVLVGPGGPTGIIGPAGYGRRPVLVGPGGPTGIIGPGRRQGVLVGPGGPTGFVGPRYGRQYNPGVLVGPGGPTGVIGPGRQLLVGPGGPTGQIGPYGK
ncbi:hypothetical protein K1T71_001540 [Dendrolimus kikuchii]|uniref:Uncharacterized protein n=1 Tax=Dendrolimus kikuchii TaxID=765133 RepID=A0ACC1DII8_9NEOP|nr:hypothetical protein K1T71_001540 [Dendrolimus kikuchii]